MKRKIILRLNTVLLAALLCFSTAVGSAALSQNISGDVTTVVVDSSDDNTFTYDVAIDVAGGNFACMQFDVTVSDPDNLKVTGAVYDSDISSVTGNTMDSIEATNKAGEAKYSVYFFDDSTNAFADGSLDICRLTFEYTGIAEETVTLNNVFVGRYTGEENEYGAPLMAKYDIAWEKSIVVQRGETSAASAPTASPAAGTYSGTKSVTLSSATSGAKIYYTTNGSTPTTSSTLYSGAISVSESTTIKAIAVKDGYTNSSVSTFAYVISSGSSGTTTSGGTTTTQTASAPTASPAAGTYTAAQSVSLSTATSGASIYYTTNGTTPTSSSTLYTGAIAVGSTTTIKAIAVKSGYTTSGVASFTYTISSVSPAFSDVSGHWAASYISDAVKAGYVSGFTDGTFKPDAYVTRAQFVKMIVVAFGFTGSGTDSFADSANHWALPQIKIAAYNGLVNGTVKSDGTYFMPDDNISREQVATILYRAAAKLGITLPETSAAISFSDQSSISSYAVTAVAAMQKAGIINGSTSNGKTVFDPQGNATRAQAVKMIQGLLALR